MHSLTRTCTKHRVRYARTALVSVLSSLQHLACWRSHTAQQKVFSFLSCHLGATRAKQEKENVFRSPLHTLRISLSAVKCYTRRCILCVYNQFVCNPPLTGCSFTSPFHRSQKYCCGGCFALVLFISILE